jgi:hypothetical protein
LKIPLLAGCQMYQIPFSQGSPFPAAIQSSRGNLICILHENLTLNFWFHAGSGRKRSLIPWLWSPYCGIFNRLYPTPIEEKNATRRRIKISESSIHGFSLCHLIPSSFRTPKLMSKAKPFELCEKFESCASFLCQKHLLPVNARWYLSRTELLQSESDKASEKYLRI